MVSHASREESRTLHEFDIGEIMSYLTMSFGDYVHW